jgi:uncharacterized protein YndB with AHSA1/START domain
MLKKIALVIAVLLAGVLIAAATRPDSFQLQRSTHIQAPPAKVFALIDDFHHWAAWSPWDKMDPAMKRSHTGPASGPGAHYAWQGNSKVGAGSMTIADSTPPHKLRVQLDFLTPFEAHNIAEFTLQPAAGGTDVTWAMSGPQPFVAKLMGLFFSMEKMVGPDFEAGLANLKAAAEKT